MITAIHTLAYADDAPAARAFPNVDTEQHHEISLTCDDLASTMGDLQAKGARFT